MSIHEQKKRERELKRELDAQDRRIARNQLLARQGLPPEAEESAGTGATATNSSAPEASKVSKEVLPPPGSPGPAIKVSIGVTQPIPEPMIYTRKGVVSGRPIDES